MTYAPVYDVIERMVERHRRGRLLLLFDYDGTLAPFADRPERATLPQQTRRLLTRLGAAPRVDLGIVSGRALDDLRELLRLPGVYLAGTGGVELDLRGEQVEPPAAEHGRAWIRAVVPAVRSALVDFEGAWVEAKPLGLTVHFRGLADGRSDDLRRAAIRVLSQVGTLRIEEGAAAIEATFDIGLNRGTAVRTIYEHSGGGRAGLLYAGDGPNDRLAFEMTMKLGGVALGIGPHAPATARHRLRDPGELTGVLEHVARAVHVPS